MIAENGYFQKRVLRLVIRWIRAALYSPLGVGRFLGVPLPVALAYSPWACKVDSPLRNAFLKLGR
jgi:hypothetical protein